MNNQTPTAQSGPSAKRLAAARYALNAAQMQWRHDISDRDNARAVDDAIEELEAAAIAADQEAPPAGARDAVREQDAIDYDNGFRRYPWTYENQPGNVGAWALGEACNKAMQGSAGDYIDRGLGLLKELHAKGLGIVRVPALTGKADEGDAKCPACDGQGWDYNYTPRDRPSTIKCAQCKGTGKATQPAATGAGDGESQATLDTFAAIHASDKFTVDAARDAFAGVESVRAQVNPRQTNTAATGMGELPSSPWLDISELEQSDDLFWFLRRDRGEWIVDGPRTPQADGYDADEWTWFAPCESPPTAALAAQPAPVALDDAASDIPAWHLIEVAERLGAVKESSDDEMWWTLNLTTFYAIEKELHAAVNAHQYAQCAQPAPVVGGAVGKFIERAVNSANAKRDRYYRLSDALQNSYSERDAGSRQAYAEAAQDFGKFAYWLRDHSHYLPAISARPAESVAQGGEGADHQWFGPDPHGNWYVRTGAKWWYATPKTMLTPEEFGCLNEDPKPETTPTESPVNEERTECAPQAQGEIGTDGWNAQQEAQIAAYANHPALKVPCKHCGTVGMCPYPLACVSAAANELTTPTPATGSGGELLAARPAESVIGDVDGVARLLADAAGHGMREKCEPLARQIVELLAARPGGEGETVASGGESVVDRAIYDYMCAADNQDVPLERWPARIVKALAMVGYAVVPCQIPFEVLGEAQRSGVFETGNPTHGWDYLIGKTRVYLIAPNSAHPAQAGGEVG